ncbi:MAG: hypothetical protein LC640_09095 [Frankia sp.]|nr:hypothetical protein [Frankia sp.]
MRRLLCLAVLLAGCGGESAVVTAADAGSWSPEGRWLVPFGLVDSPAPWITFAGDAYERGGGCGERGMWRLVDSIDDYGDPARDVVLSPAAGACEGHALLVKSPTLLWLRPRPFVQFYRR